MSTDEPQHGFASPSGPPVEPGAWAAAPPSDGGRAPVYHHQVDVGAGLAIAAAALSVVLGLVWLGNSLSMIPMATEIADGATADDTSIAASAPYYLSALLSYVMIVPAWVLTAVWLVHARDAAVQIAPHTTQRRGNAWVVLGWVVPIASFFVPVQVVGDLARAATARLAYVSDALVGWWWATFLATLILSRMSSSAFDGLDAGEPAGTVVTLALVVGALTVVSLTLWLLVIRRIVTGLARRAVRG